MFPRGCLPPDFILGTSITFLEQALPTWDTRHGEPLTETIQSILLPGKRKSEHILDLHKTSTLGFQILSTRHGFRIFRHVSVSSLYVGKKLDLKRLLNRRPELPDKIIVNDVGYIVYNALIRDLKVRPHLGRDDNLLLIGVNGPESLEIGRLLHVISQSLQQSKYVS